MKTCLLFLITTLVLLIIPAINSGKTINHGTAPDSMLLASNWTESNTRILLSDMAITTSAASNTARLVVKPAAIHVQAGPDVPDAEISGQFVSIYPNPFKTFLQINVNDSPLLQKIEFRMYDLLGVEVMNTTLTKQSNTLKAADLPSGMYFFRIISNNKTIQSGRLISLQ
jgi:hypothetical protein